MAWDPSAQINSAEKVMSYTVTEENGQQTAQINSEVTVNATDRETNEDASATQMATYQLKPDDGYTKFRVEEGTARKSDAKSSLEGDDYQQRVDQMPGGRVPYRHTTVVDDGVSTVYEVGNYDDPRREGGTVAVTSTKDGPTTQSYRLVSEGGNRVQEQSTVPGTEFSQYSDTDYGTDGDDQTFVRTIETKDGGTTLSSSTQERTVAYASGADMPVTAPAGMDQKQWDEFRAQKGNGPVYSDEFSSDTLVPEETKETIIPKSHPQKITTPAHRAQTSVSGYSWGNSSIGSVTQTEKGQSTTTQAMLTGGENSAASFVVDGKRADINAQGEVTVDGVLTGTVDAGQALASVPAAYTALMDEIHSTPSAPPSGTDWTKVSSHFSKGLGAAGILGGVLGIATGEKASEVVNGVGTTVAGAGGLAEGFGTSNIVKNIGKGLGIAGGGFTAAAGLIEIFSEDGNLAKGIADTVSGAAGMTAGVLALCGVTGPAGWIVGGVALAASLVSWGIDIFSEPDQAELKF